jgi:hypothetical protein
VDRAAGVHDPELPIRRTVAALGTAQRPAAAGHRGALAENQLRTGARERLRAVVADGFYRTTFHGLLALALFVVVFWLFEDERIPAVFVALEVVRGGLSAQVAVDALIVDVILAASVIRILIVDVSHRISEKVGRFIGRGKTKIKSFPGNQYGSAGALDNGCLELERSVLPDTLVSKLRRCLNPP